MRYSYLNSYPNVFVKMTGLRVAEFDALVSDVLPAFSQAEIQRLSRPNRQREMGGGRWSELDPRNQVLLTAIWLRVYPTHDVLGYLFGVSAITVGRIIKRVLPLLTNGAV